MANQLTTKQSSGTQDASNNNLAQPASQTANTGTPIGSVQPTSTGELLRSQIGIPLSNTPISTISLAPTTAAQVTKPVQRHINPALFGVSALLFIVAVVLFWMTANTGKKHNVN